MIDNEAQLAGLAYALIGQSSALTKAEQRLVDRRQDVPASLVNTTRKAIRVGDDPLGSHFCRLRSPEERREDGATYTQPAIRSPPGFHGPRASRPRQVRIVDPGSGSGLFLFGRRPPHGPFPPPSWSPVRD